MQRRIEEKWRPPLLLVLGCTLAAVFCLPLAGIVIAKLTFPNFGIRDSVSVSAIPVAIVASVVGWVLYRILLRPITTLASRADAIRTGEAEALDPLTHYGTSEMVALGKAMRQMGQVFQGRETVLRTYADHVTHELKSPLSVIQGAAELLVNDDLPDNDRRQMIESIATATDRMQDLLDAQKDLARASEPLAPGKCMLSDAVPIGSDITIKRDDIVPLPAQLVELVLTHLIGNSRAHGATRVELTASKDTLLITDNGPGISQGNKNRIFDPFFTTRRKQGGTGMGLAIVQRMLEAQGATIHLLDGPGAVFEVRY